MDIQWIYKIIVDDGPLLLYGAGVALVMALIGTIFGSLIGLIIGVVRTIPTSDSTFVRWISKIINGLFLIYVTIFRGTPMIVQAMVIYYGSAQGLGLNMNRIFAGILIISLNTGAYMSETVRGGIQSISNGQLDATKAIGISHLDSMLHVILPQVLRQILPVLGNTFVMNIKDTSVLNVISITEIFFQTKSIAGSNFRYFESFFVATLIYLAMTIIASLVLKQIEKKVAGSKNYTLFVQPPLI